LRIKFLTVAETEFDQAVYYYESKRPELGSKFRNEILRSLKLIALYPTAFQPLGSRSRRCLVSRFPYGIIYRYKQDTGEIIVIAVAHLHRKSDYWLSRLP
jgi:toxin ParE2